MWRIFYGLLSLLMFSPSVAEQSIWQLVWSDEFNVDGRLDTEKWIFETGGEWANGEAQHYTDREKNVRVADGKLVIEAHKEDFGGNSYTSGRLNSKAAWTYGRIEVRAKLATGSGAWPAIWMMPRQLTYGTELWPDNGEIDIMEYAGREPGQIIGSFHTKNFNWMLETGKTEVAYVPGIESDYHVYTLEWSEDEMILFIDDVKYNTFKNPRTEWADWPFNHDMYLILNLALGGFGGEIDEMIFPQKLLIDYVRVFQKL